MAQMWKRLKRPILATVFLLMGLAIILIASASPITKYLVEKYDEKYTGRQIKMDWAYVNPFTGYFYFRNFKVLESDTVFKGMRKDSIFFSCNGLGLRLSLLKLFSDDYEIRSLTLDAPNALIIQNKSKTDFNFNDLLERFKPDTIETGKGPVHFKVSNVKLNNGEFHYRENVIPIKYYVTKVNMDCDGISWDVDTVRVNYSFEAGPGTGDVRGQFMINKEKRDYRLAAVVTNLDMNLIGQYLKDLTNYGAMRAYFDADVHAAGNMDDATSLDASGRLAIRDFHFGKNEKEDYASFKEFSLEYLRLHPSGHVYDLDTVTLTKPFVEYEKYDHLDNFQNIFGKEGSNVRAAYQDSLHFNLILEIADYLKKIVKNFFRSYYKINHLAIEEGNFRYSDYSLNEKFTIAAQPLRITADSIDKNRERVKMNFASGIDPYGSANVFLSVNPKDSDNFDLNYHIEKVPVAIFNPYMIRYTSYPMDRGIMAFKGEWNVRQGAISSTNRVLVIDPRIARRIKGKDKKWLPLPVVMAFVRERGNVIDYDIPIKGNLNDPDFKIKDVLLDLLKNIFIKPPTLPYGIQVTEAEQEIEKTLSIKWETGQSGLRPAQQKFLKKMADFLEENPATRVSAFPIEYTQKEKEYILLYEARKKYFLARNKKKPKDFGKEDSISVSKMSVKDPDFVKYLDAHNKGIRMFTVQEKAAHLVGNQVVDEAYARLKRQRKENFHAFFRTNALADRVKIKQSTSLVPPNGFSFFKIDYGGEVPHYLRKAYAKMEELDAEFPRKKYFWERKRVKEFFQTTKKNTNEIHSAGTLGGQP